MKRLLLCAALTLPLAGCFEVGPPNYNERDRRAYNSLQDVDRDHYRADDGYYYHDDRYGNRDNNHDGDDDYNPHDGHDHWVRHSN